MCIFTGATTTLLTHLSVHTYNLLPHSKDYCESSYQHHWNANDFTRTSTHNALSQLGIMYINMLQVATSQVMYSIVKI